MKRIAVLLFLIACSTPALIPPSDSGFAVDASVAIDSASPDAPTPPESGNGCRMGNLPKSRTITVGAADAVPSAVIDELQDRDIAQSGQRDIYILGEAFCNQNIGGGATVSYANGRWTMVMTAGQTAALAVNISLPPGMVVTDLRSSHNSSVSNTASAVLESTSFGDGEVTVVNRVQGGIATVTGWQITQASFFGPPYTVVSGVGHRIRFVTNSTPAGTILFDGVRLSVYGP